MSSLRAYERINEIRIADLMFTKPETSTLYKTLLGPKLDDKLIDKLLKKTEGWVVGLILTIHIIKSSKDLKSILEKVSGGSYMISEYLISEVLDRQKVEMQNLLLKTSVLDKFCSDLLDSLNETDLLPGSDKIDGQEFIDSLKRSNLFIISLDDENRWFRYHHLFRETIKNELKKQKTEAEISQIHEHVSKWFERNNYIQQSIYHEIAGGNIIEAGNIISRHRVAEFDNDNWYVVQRWIHMIPKNIRHKSPHLLLSEAWCAYENFQLEKIPPYLDHIKSLLNDNDDNQTLWGEWYLFNGLISYWFGNAEIALPHLQKAIKLLSETQMLFMGMAHLHIGLARAVTGQNELAIKELNNLLSNGKEDILYNTRLVAGLFYINYFAGNIKFSRREAQRLQNISERHNLYYTNAMGVCMEAISCFNSYALQDALHLFEIAEQNRYILHKGTALDAIAGKIITHQLLQQPNEANKSLGLLESFEKEIDSSALLSISKSCNARLALLRGDLKSALSWETTLNEKLTYAGLFVWIEIPMLTQVRVLISKGTAESLVRAEYLLKEFILKSRHFHLTNQIIEALGLKSMLYEKQGDSKEALKILNEVLELSAPKLWIRPFIELGNPMAELLKKITEHSKFSEFINVILRFFDLRKEVIHSSADTSDPGKEADSITEREIEILNLIAQGFRNNEIADKLFLSAKTIKGYNYKIYKKLNVNSRIQAIERAKILKIIK
jgi:LuxR family maltose regulon positive regulatory protein